MLCTAARTLLLRDSCRQSAQRVIAGSRALDSLVATAAAGGDSAEAATAPPQPHMNYTDLDGPRGLPFFGNFHTYAKKGNQHRIHELQVSRFCSYSHTLID